MGSGWHVSLISRRLQNENYSKSIGAETLESLRSPPGNRLEALKRDRSGLYSIRVNDQWRVCFRFDGSDAFDVEIVDYH